MQMGFGGRAAITPSPSGGGAKRISENQAPFQEAPSAEWERFLSAANRACTPSASPDAKLLRASALRTARLRVSGANGLRRKTAPSSILELNKADSAEWPVVKTTGRSGRMTHI